jgi:hypothetical protein
MSDYQDFFNEVDKLGGGGGIFPAGVYRGKITGPSKEDDSPVLEVGTPPSWDNQDDSLQRLRFALVECSALDGDDPGDQWMFVDLTISQNGTDLDNMPEKDTNEYYAITSTIVKLGDLAHQLGVVDNPVKVNVAEMVHLLADGEFDNSEVQFETFHKSYKKRDGTPGKSARLTPRGFSKPEEE